MRMPEARCLVFVFVLFFFIPELFEKCKHTCFVQSNAEHGTGNLLGEKKKNLQLPHQAAFKGCQIKAFLTTPLPNEC